TGYPLTLEDLERFRQLGSRTPGHPEHDPECGVETTTGPLGQGLANGVGMALAEKLLASEFNRPGFNVIDHYTYVFCGDGCLMEGVSHEACSLAGTWGLGKLIVFYDDNGISIDGKVAGWFTDDTPRRFEAYGWHVVPRVDGLDAGAVTSAIEAARAVEDRPSLICCQTIIGYGAPHRPGTTEAHGETLAKQSAPQATRQSSQAVLNLLGPALPEILGGSADLTGSNNTLFKGARTLTPGGPSGNYLHYGVREFGMTAIMNGVSLHGGLLAYGGTFLVFSDYARNAVRLACMMKLKVIWVYTHDSIGLGEDGPTHQPIEHLTSLRAMPNMNVWRPCDAAETAVAWTLAVERRAPTALVLTRQALPQQRRSPAQLGNISRGGYVLIDPGGTPECVVIATGSEVGIAAQAVSALNASGRRVRLVSMPSAEGFDAQDAGYRESVLPRAVTRRLAVEAGATVGWWRYVGASGRVLGIDRFGASGKAADVFPYFGFTADNIALAI